MSILADAQMVNVLPFIWNATKSKTATTDQTKNIVVSIQFILDTKIFDLFRDIFLYAYVIVLSKILQIQQWYGFNIIIILDFGQDAQVSSVTYFDGEFLFYFMQNSCNDIQYLHFVVWEWLDYLNGL